MPAPEALKDVADDLALLAESRDPGLKGFSEQILLALDRLYQASPGAELAAEHRLAMEKLQREAYSLVSGARLRGISVLNLAREVDESGRHWLRSLAVTNDVRQ